MKSLIRIKERNGEKAVSARELHQFLEVQTKFGDWINRRIEEYGFIENQDFILISQNWEIKNKRGGDRKSKEYILTMDMAKELSMVERNEKGKQARRYFIEVEKRAKEHLLKIPTAKTYNGVRCIHYISWLIQNNYSLMSGQVRARIRKYPEQFRQTKDGWYMSEAIANYYLAFKNPQQRLAELPSINPKQLQLF